LKFNEALKRVLDYLATDLIESTQARVEQSGAASTDELRRVPQRLAGFSRDASRLVADLKRFLVARIYTHPAITEDRDRSVRSLDQLFKFYDSSPGSMPASYEEATTHSPRGIVVCDYIAGMTDQFLLRQHHEHFGPADL
jgi:dGTPase